jgi:hypothetical protein
MASTDAAASAATLPPIVAAPVTPTTGGAVYHGRKNAGAAAAESRLEQWRSLSADEQLRQLDRRLGKGMGAKKQRDRLLRKLGIDP